MSNIILASQSPRRKALLESVGISFDVQVSQQVETIDGQLPIEQAIEQVALQKAKAIANTHNGKIVIGADTVVVYQGEIFEKPKSKEDAYRMLRELSNQTHCVITGVAIIMDSSTQLFHSSTDVTFYELSEADIEAYIQSGEPFDKAGAYGIQGFGKIFVKSIQGDYFNVVGLPIAEVYQRIKKYI